MLAAFAIAEHHESEPSVALAKSTYAPGEDIVVNFSNGPGNRDDWIGIYKADLRSKKGKQNVANLSDPCAGLVDNVGLSGYCQRE
jgi:hypothetical protein